jgi:hypothetical protein
MIHVITYYDIIPGRENDYEEFVKTRAAGVMKNLPVGVRLEGAWNPINNNNRVYTLMCMDRLSTLEDLLESQDWREMIKVRDSMVTNINIEYLVPTGRREKYGY